MGRKSIPILLKATSPEGETKMFTSIGEAAKELGFSERGVGKAFHEKRNRIGEYELEWLESELDVDRELDVHPKAAARIERLKKTCTQTVCTYCGKPLTREDRVNKGNVLITTRRDKQRFILSWQSIHERCFQIRKEKG